MSPTAAQILGRPPTPADYLLDYSAARLSGHTIASAGYSGSIRYIDDPKIRFQPKHVSKAEYLDHRATGLWVDFVVEVGVNDADGGYSAGKDKANRALRGLDAIGWDGVGRIFAATNDKTTLPSATTWSQHIEGMVQVLGPDLSGVYGFVNAIDVAKRDWPDVARWLAGSSNGIGGRNLTYWQDNNTQITVGGITCDRNLIITPLRGGGAGTGALMALSSAQQDELLRKVNDLWSVVGGYNYWWEKEHGPGSGAAAGHTIGQAVYDIESVVGAAWSDTDKKGIGALVRDLYARPAVGLTDAQVALLADKIANALPSPAGQGGMDGEVIRQIVAQEIRGAFARGGGTTEGTGIQ